MGKEQAVIQEEEYSFPYHYIPEWNEGNFSQVVRMSWGYEYAAYSRFLLELVQDYRPNSILDVGCGDGRFLYELSKTDGAGHLAGVDYYGPAIRFAEIMAPGVEWVAGDIRDPSVLAREFEIVTLVEVLEHIKPSAIPDFLKGIYERVSTDGMLIISVPHKNLSVQRKHYQHFHIESLIDTLRPWFTVVDKYYLNRKVVGFKRLILRAISNNQYMITNRSLNRLAFRLYCDKMLMADVEDCRRLVVVCRKLAAG